MNTENKLIVTKGVGVRNNWEVGIDTFTLLYVQQVTNENPGLSNHSGSLVKEPSC